MRLTDLSRREWGIFDAFEDDRYDLGDVELTSGGRGLAYLWPEGDVRDENWDAQQFKVLHLQEYAARCARIAPAWLPKLASRSSGVRGAAGSSNAALLRGRWTVAGPPACEAGAGQ
ncbi:hypothetical protein [Streptomyces sp. NPDC048637]|uniref:hypothetical protein n=1 Tax=Streptomyces sp. NPDC048637 TaxID=3155636 RepID=UPI0034415699